MAAVASRRLRSGEQLFSYPQRHRQMAGATDNLSTSSFKIIRSCSPREQQGNDEIARKFRTDNRPRRPRTPQNTLVYPFGAKST